MVVNREMAEEMAQEEEIIVGALVEFPAEAVIMKEGDAPDVFYKIEEGNVKVMKDAGVITTFEKGEYVGELSFLSQKKESRTATVIAVTKVTLRQMGGKSFLKNCLTIQAPLIDF